MNSSNLRAIFLRFILVPYYEMETAAYFQWILLIPRLACDLPRK